MALVSMVFLAYLFREIGYVCNGPHAERFHGDHTHRLYTRFCLCTCISNVWGRIIASFESGDGLISSAYGTHSRAVLALYHVLLGDRFVRHTMK